MVLFMKNYIPITGSGRDGAPKRNPRGLDLESRSHQRRFFVVYWTSITSIGDPKDTMTYSVIMYSYSMKRRAEYWGGKPETNPNTNQRLFHHAPSSLDVLSAPSLDGYS